MILCVFLNLINDNNFFFLLQISYFTATELRCTSFIIIVFASVFALVSSFNHLKVWIFQARTALKLLAMLRKKF